MRWPARLAVLAALLLAGCVSGPGGCVPPREPDDVPVGAPAEGGFGADAVRVQVVDEQGRGLAGAAVVAIWNREYIAPPDDEDDEVPQAPLLEYVELRTDAEARAVAWVPAGRFLMVSATAPGYTEEWTPLHWPGASPLEVVMALHPSTLVVRTTGTVPAGAGHGLQDNAWTPVLLAWPPSSVEPGPQRAGGSSGWLDERLVRLEAWMAWSTGTAEIAQLGFGFGEREDTMDAGAAPPATDVGPAYNLSATYEPDLESPFFSHYAEGVWIGPFRSGSYVSLDGVPYSIEARATLDHRAVATVRCGVVFPSSEQRPAAPGAEERPGVGSSSDIPAAAWMAPLGLLAAVAVRRRAP